RHVWHRVWRIWIFVGPGPFENVSAFYFLPIQIACLTTGAHHLFSLPVARLDVAPGDAPILYAQLLRKFPSTVSLFQMRLDGEGFRKEARLRSAPMVSGTTHAGSGVHSAVLTDGVGPLFVRRPMGEYSVGRALEAAPANLRVYFVHFRHIGAVAAK